MIDQITDNAKAILLMCGRFGPADERAVGPLSIKEYDELATWLFRKKMWPSDLLKADKAEVLNDAFTPVPAERLKTLLARGVAMAMAIEKWTNKGLWVVCRGDENYPQRLKLHLRGDAPPILYGVGEGTLLSQGGLAVVGSRHIDADGQEFARALGRSAAQCGMQLISGAARGVDETAMHGAFSAGGKVIGVMADSLLRAAVSGKYREGIRGGQLVLVSPYNPEAGFNVGNAMGRNKYIYALSDFAVVVSSDYQSGGTWAGAEEELQRRRRRTIFVRTGAAVPRGNAELLKLGAKPLPADALAGSLRDVLQKATGSQPESPEALEEPMSVAAATPSEPRASLATQPEPKPEIANTPAFVPQTAPPATVYDAVKPLILESLEKPTKLQELAKTLQVRKGQLDDWVKALIKDGVLEERAVGKSKSIARRKLDEELKLS